MKFSSPTRKRLSAEKKRSDLQMEVWKILPDSMLRTIFALGDKEKIDLVALKDKEPRLYSDLANRDSLDPLALKMIDLREFRFIERAVYKECGCLIFPPAVYVDNTSFAQNVKFSIDGHFAPAEEFHHFLDQGLLPRTEDGFLVNNMWRGIDNGIGALEKVGALDEGGAEAFRLCFIAWDHLPVFLPKKVMDISPSVHRRVSDLISKHTDELMQLRKSLCPELQEGGITFGCRALTQPTFLHSFSGANMTRVAHPTYSRFSNRSQESGPDFLIALQMYYQRYVKGVKDARERDIITINGEPIDDVLRDYCLYQYGAIKCDPISVRRIYWIRACETKRNTVNEEGLDMYQLIGRKTCKTKRNTVNEEGLDIHQLIGRKGCETKRNTVNEEGLDMYQLIGRKTCKTKRSTVNEEGLNTLQLIGRKACETKRNTIVPDGRTKQEHANEAVSFGNIQQYHVYSLTPDGKQVATVFGKNDMEKAGKKYGYTVRWYKDHGSKALKNPGDTVVTPNGKFRIELVENKPYVLYNLGTNKVFRRWKNKKALYEDKETLKLLDTSSHWLKTKSGWPTKQSSICLPIGEPKFRLTRDDCSSSM